MLINVTTLRLNELMNQSISFCFKTNEYKTSYLLNVYSIQNQRLVRSQTQRDTALSRNARVAIAVQPQ